MALTLRYSSHQADGVSSCGGAVNNTAAGIIANTSPLNAVFDKVLKNENIAGTTEYRLLYLANDSTQTQKVYTPRLKLISTPDSEIALGPLAKNVIGATIATEKTTPPSVVFKTQTELNAESAGYLAFTNGDELAPGEFLGFWIRRKVSSSSGSGTIKEELVLEVQYRS